MSVASFLLQKQKCVRTGHERLFQSPRLGMEMMRGGGRGFYTELPPPQFALSLTSDSRKEWERKANRLFVTPFTFNGL